ncbi:MAG: hypothetical protein RH947_09095 [Alcanivorax sp.]|jgi:hypothetical protein|uniref:hypothetical protein n=1 Tax=Alloalcanivorax venustensis TaxID=172371 RepID=UPI0032FB7E82
MRVSIYIFGIGILLSQFYFLKSGLPQPAHFLLILPFVFYLSRERAFTLWSRLEAAPLFLVVLFFYSLFVNLSYGLYFQSFEFLFPIVHLFYGLSVYFVLQNLLTCRTGQVEKINLFLFAGLAVLFFMALAGFGNYRFFPRYNAFFNDPNQMAFWALCVGSMLLAQRTVSDVTKGFVFLFLFYVILQSASRSGLVGFSILFFGFVVGYARNVILLSNSKKLFGALLGASVVLILGYIFVRDNVEAMTFVGSRLDQVDIQSQADIRGYTRFFEFPEFLFLGAGQGAEYRFNDAGTEIHSTWAALLFYYGLPGIFLMLEFIRRVAKGLSFPQKLIFAAPLLYSFSTLGYRTPIFWVFLAFFFCLTILQNEKAKAASEFEAVG